MLFEAVECTDCSRRYGGTEPPPDCCECGGVLLDELHTLRTQLAACRAALQEARDTVQASLAETGISDFRREYRRGLLQRLDAALAAEDS